LTFGSRPVIVEGMSVINSLQAYVAGQTSIFNIFIDEWWSADSRNREIRIDITLPDIGTLAGCIFKVFDPTGNTPLLELVEKDHLVERAIKGCEASVLDSIYTHKKNMQKMEVALKELREPNDLSESIVLQQLKDDAEEGIVVYE